MERGFSRRAAPGVPSVMDWNVSHPFRLGQVVYAARDMVIGGVAFSAGRAVSVHLRGFHEASCRFWFSATRHPGLCLPCDLFLSVPPLPPVADEDVPPDHDADCGTAAAAAPRITETETIQTEMP